MSSIRFAIFNYYGRWILEKRWTEDNRPRVDEIGEYDTYEEASGVYRWHRESYSEAEELEA